MLLAYPAWFAAKINLRIEEGDRMGGPKGRGWILKEVREGLKETFLCG